MDGRFPGRDETCAHVDAVRPHCERGDKLRGRAHAAGGDKGNFQFFRRAGQQDHVGDIVFAGMAAAFETIDADRVAADALRLQRMADGGAFVNDLDAAFLHGGHIGFRAAAGRFHNLHAAGNDRIDIFWVRRICEARQEREIDADRLVGHVIAFRDFLREVFRRRLRQRRDDAETARVGDGGGHLGEADKMHAALDDRMPDAEQLCNARLHIYVSRMI